MGSFSSLTVKIKVQNDPKIIFYSVPNIILSKKIDRGISSGSSYLTKKVTYFFEVPISQVSFWQSRPIHVHLLVEWNRSCS